MGNDFAKGIFHILIFLITFFTSCRLALSLPNKRPINQPTFSYSKITSNGHIKADVSSSSEFPVLGSETLMTEKQHGSCTRPVQNELRWKVDRDLADRICCFNRHYAEHSGYFRGVKPFMSDALDQNTKEITFYDSVSGKPLFIAPRNRSMEAFLEESRAHGWPSFRDSEVIWENVRCLANGEAISLDGTHLGHNLPDGKGNRYCINLVSVAGHSTGDSSHKDSEKSSL